MPQISQYLQDKKVSTLLIILIFFFAAMFISVMVNVQNQIKKGHYIGQDIESQYTITVNGQGEVYIQPDLALVVFSVVNEAKTVGQAMAANTEKMNAVINWLKEQGVDKKDLKTTNFNLYPRYEYQEKSSSLYPSGKRILVGYEVRQSLQVKIRNLDTIGELIQGASSRGSNQAGDLQFTIDNTDEAKAQAREQAIKQAKEKANDLAKQLGVSLGRITNFYESGQTPYYGAARAMSVDYAEEAAAPQIEVGENEIKVNVSITYEIR